MPKHEHRDGGALLEVLYWWTTGLRARVPDRVLKHPMWPENNRQFSQSLLKHGYVSTSHAGRDRLWEAIAIEYGLDLKGQQKE